MAKKILVVDDSALMRRVLCDIINSDKRFQVEDTAKNGLEAFELLGRVSYDAVVLDINMPKMNGLELLEELRKAKIAVRVLVVSTSTRKGAKTTLDALELGALDFIHKPDSEVDCRTDMFQKRLLRMLDIVAQSSLPLPSEERGAGIKRPEIVRAKGGAGSASAGKACRKVVAITCSTGGPKALQSVIPSLPADLDASVLLVQHMPQGFTASLAERLDSMSELAVKEAQEGDRLQRGTVYVAMGGLHMNVAAAPNGEYQIHYSDEPCREGVKPCANYMYESLADSSFEQIVCVVMTGMGSDGTEGIRHLEAKKKVHVIAQDQQTCVVYGMPKSIIRSGIEAQVVPLDQIAQEIVTNVGVIG